MEHCENTEVIDKMIDEYNKLFVNKQVHFINALTFGIIDNDCSVPFVSMLIHSMENIEIFRGKHLAKLSRIITRINYE